MREDKRELRAAEYHAFNASSFPDPSDDREQLLSRFVLDNAEFYLFKEDVLDPFDLLGFRRSETHVIFVKLLLIVVRCHCKPGAKKAE